MAITPVVPPTLTTPAIPLLSRQGSGFSLNLEASRRMGSLLAALPELQAFSARNDWLASVLGRPLPSINRSEGIAMLDVSNILSGVMLLRDGPGKLAALLEAAANLTQNPATQATLRDLAGQVRGFVDAAAAGNTAPVAPTGRPAPDRAELGAGYSFAFGTPPQEELLRTRSVTTLGPGVFELELARADGSASRFRLMVGRVVNVAVTVRDSVSGDDLGQPSRLDASALLRSLQSDPSARTSPVAELIARLQVAVAREAQTGFE